MSASVKDIEYLKRAVSRLVKASIAESWIGAKDPEDHAAIEAELIAARAQYARAIERLKTP